MHDTITAPAPAAQGTTTEFTPELERAFDEMADEMLLGVAKRSRTKKVGGSRSARLAPQSGESRAWTKSGNVD